MSLNLTVPTGEAEELVALAEVLPERLPRTWAALRTGQIDYGRAVVMMTGVFALPDEAARRIDADLIGEAAHTCRTRLRAKVTKAAKTADPAAFTERTRQAKADRRVELWDNDDDTCDLVGRNLSAADAHAIRNRLTAAASAMRADGDTRTLNQLRADLYRDLLRGIPLPQAAKHLHLHHTEPDPGDRTPHEGTAPHPARMHTRPVGGATTIASPAADEEISGSAAATPGHDVNATVEALIGQALAQTVDDQLTLLLDRARADGRLDRLPRLIGNAAVAIRDALADVVDTWCRATAAPGAAASPRHGHDGYAPPAAMRRLVQRRHTTCTFPTCNRQSVHSDLDHTIPYDKDGRTCKCNLSPLCRTHHRIIKQHLAWKLIQPWPGLLIWVTPAGKWHIVMPQ